MIDRVNPTKGLNETTAWHQSRDRILKMPCVEKDVFTNEQLNDGMTMTLTHKYHDVTKRQRLRI